MSKICVITIMFLISPNKKNLTLGGRRDFGWM